MTTIRMLLSHNFDIDDHAIPALSREAFTDILTQALQGCAQCQLVTNAHWIVEVRFDGTRFTPDEMGDRYVQALAQARRSSLKNDVKFPEVLALGGLKTTPALSSSPDSLQPNEWGVDVVETENADRFLEGLNWKATIAARPPGTIFQAIVKSI